MSRSKSKRDLLTDLRDHLDKVTTFTQAGRAAFYDDEMAQFAVIRVYEVFAAEFHTTAWPRGREWNRDRKQPPPADEAPWTPSQ